MAITFTNARQINHSANAVPWNNQPKASLSFFYRYESAGGTTAAVLNTNYFIVRGLGSFYVFTSASGVPGTLNVRFVVSGSTGSSQHVHTLNVGTAYHIALTYDQGAQICWINGVPYTMGALTVNTASGPWPVAFGVSTVPGTPFIYTLHDFAIWNGYVLTPTEIANLRDGHQLPPAIGASAPWRARWTMAGTTGATVTLGDAGIANDYADPTYDITHFAGSGTAVYSPALAFVPSVTATPYVATSGKLIGFTFNAVSNGAVITPTQLTTPPTISKNGVSLGPLVNPWITGYHQCLLCALPAGASIAPGDAVTLSVAAGWANTGIGIVAALDGATTIDNRAGRSSMGTDLLPRTLRPGWNNSHLAFSNSSTYSVARNWIRRCGSFAAATYDSNRKPLTGGSQIEGIFYDVGPFSTIDQTLVVPVGYWAICWDDTDPTHVPTILNLVSASTLILSITEMLDGYNPGSGGVGICRVFRVDALSTLPGTGNNDSPELRLRISNTTGAYHFDNAVIYGPGDFTYTPGVPTVVDRSDPYAISNAYLNRLGNSAGSLRWVDSLFGFAGMSQESEPEQVYKITDFIWDESAGKINKGVFFATARPWDTSVTPYIYTTLFGSPYNVTLSAPIVDTTGITVTVTPDPASPVIIGLRLKVDNELMRVLAVNGPTVTVERGSCSTVAATHAAGTIQVQNRWDATGTHIPKGMLFELTCAAPHGINTGQALKAVGNWPVFTFTDGLQSFSGKSIATFGGANLLLVTGQNTVLGILPGNESPWVTLNQTYTLDSTCKLGAQWPDTPAIPVEFAAKVAGHFDGCNLHINVPHTASDSLVNQIAVWVRDNFPAGRRVYVEYTNEPWNFAFVAYPMIDYFSRWLYPGTTNGWEFYVLRATQVWTQFRSVFGARSGEIFGMINSMKSDAAGSTARLDFARGLGVPADIVAVAPYTILDVGVATQVAFWQYDDEQAVDLFAHDLRYNNNQTPSFFTAMKNMVETYNTNHGTTVQLYGYEGGVSCAAPVLNTTLSSAIDGTTLTIPVASSTGLIAGTPLKVGTGTGAEWVTLTFVAGNTLTVTRGQYGSAASAHASGVNLRPAYLERSHDIIYNPNWYFVDQDFYAQIQLAGFCNFNQYALCMGSAETNTYYGAYHTPWQVAGYGDGSDGKADNRLALACPGKVHTKSATTNQDVVSVSVRGQAFLDWMKPSAPTRTVQHFVTAFIVAAAITTRTVQQSVTATTRAAPAAITTSTVQQSTTAVTAVTPPQITTNTVQHSVFAVVSAADRPPRTVGGCYVRYLPPGDCNSAVVGAVAPYVVEVVGVCQKVPTTATGGIMALAMEKSCECDDELYRLTREVVLDDGEHVVPFRLAVRDKRLIWETTVFRTVPVGWNDDSAMPDCRVPLLFELTCGPDGKPVFEVGPAGVITLTMRYVVNDGLVTAVLPGRQLVTYDVLCSERARAIQLRLVECATGIRFQVGVDEPFMYNDGPAFVTVVGAR